MQRDVGRVAVAGVAGPVVRRCAARRPIRRRKRAGTCGTMFACGCCAGAPSPPPRGRWGQAGHEGRQLSPPKPVVDWLASRAALKSVALIHSRAPQRSVSQCARPMWSGCMCVTITRSTGRPCSSRSNTCSQAARVASLVMPQSTMAQPRGRSRVAVAQQPEVDVVEREGQRHAQPAHAGCELERAAERRQLVGQGVVELGFVGLHGRLRYT